MAENTTQRPPDVVPFPQPFFVSRVTKDKGPLTKIMRLDPETNEVVKDSTFCRMTKGRIKQISISSPAGFARFLRSLNTNQAIVFGVTKYAEARIVTKKQLRKVRQSKEAHVISRTKDCVFASYGPGVILLDHDRARAGSIGGESALTGYSPQELINIIATFYPEIATAAWVSTPSTSACIYNVEGKEIRGEGTGSHIYLFVKNVKDTLRYLSVIGQHLFLAGLGRVEISKSGSLLQRTLIDLVVGSPERLDFAAGAICEDGLVQKLPAPIVHNGQMLDTATLPDLNPELVNSFESLVTELLVMPLSIVVLMVPLRTDSTEM